MGNFMYGEWKTLDSSWDPENQKNIYSITSEYTGFIMVGTPKLDHITVKKNTPSAAEPMHTIRTHPLCPILGRVI